MGSALETFHFMESCGDEELFRLALRNHERFVGSHAAECSAPVGDQKLTARLKYATYLRYRSILEGELEEYVRENDRIEDVITQFRTARTLEVAPDGFDVLELALRCRIANMFQDVLLYI